MIRINLIPPEYIARINRRVLIAKVVLGVIAAAVLIFFVSSWHFGRSKALEVKLADLEQQMKVLQKDVENVKKIEKDIDEVQKYLDSISSINKGRFIYTRFLQDLVSDLPGTLWFGGVNTTLSGNVVSLSLRVNSNSAYDLAYWINSLETTDAYSAVTVGAIAVSDAEVGRQFTVPISAKYTYK